MRENARRRPRQLQPSLMQRVGACWVPAVLGNEAQFQNAPLRQLNGAAAAGMPCRAPVQLRVGTTVCVVYSMASMRGSDQVYTWRQDIGRDTGGGLGGGRCSWSGQQIKQVRADRVRASLWRQGNTQSRLELGAGEQNHRGPSGPGPLEACRGAVCSTQNLGRKGCGAMAWVTQRSGAALRQHQPQQQRKNSATRAGQGHRLKLGSQSYWAVCLSGPCCRCSARAAAAATSGAR